MKSAVNEYFFSLTALFLLFFNSKKPPDFSDGLSDIPSKPHTLHIYHSIFCEHNQLGQALDRLVTVSSMPYGTSTP
ncbi:MAG: hypothetical protein KA425_01995, partial [Fusicatenibacter sp.]|nr:hypothetical protein [Fusicatenibacter sp.]